VVLFDLKEVIKVKTLIQERLNHIIEKVLEAADYGAWDHVTHHLHNLTHRDFTGMNFHFDLNLLKVQDPEETKTIIRNFFKKVTSIPDERILFTERV